jgi:sporulation protein YlmC with PRC-barrel domain
MVFGEMGGRVAAVAKLPVFNLMRQRLGLQLGLLTLVGATVVNVITCAAEIGGISIVLQLLLGWSYRLLAILSTLLLVAVVWFLPFKAMERSVGLLGLFMITFIAAAAAIDVPWKDVGSGVIPTLPLGAATSTLLAYCYFIVAIISAVLFPYEVYFYSSGGIEEHWSAKDLPINRVTTIVGFALGSLLAISLLINAAVLFAPRHIDPQLPATVALQAAVPFGKIGLLLALAGMFFAFAGAAIETCLSSSYGVSQFFGWEWGRYKGKAQAPRFTISLAVDLRRRACDCPHRCRTIGSRRVRGRIFDYRLASDISAAATHRKRHKIYGFASQWSLRQHHGLVVLCDHNDRGHRSFASLFHHAWRSALKRDGYLKLVGEVRDMQIVDCDGARCGIADDIELDGLGKTLKVKALLVGPGAYRGRLPAWAQAVVKWIASERVTRVPWDAVLRITSDIRLEKEAVYYGLRVVERDLERRLSRIPGARD